MNVKEPYQIKHITATGIFAGYASVFNKLDSQSDIIIPGAFNDNLNYWKKLKRWPALLWQHEINKPIGCFTSIIEDTYGLWVEGKISLETKCGQEAHALLKMGAIDGLSIGYTPIAAVASFDGCKKLEKINLHEISLVTMPANDAARVAWVKADLNETDITAIIANLRRAVAAIT